MRSHVRVVASCLALGMLLTGCESSGERTPVPTPVIGGEGTMLEFEIAMAADEYESGEPLTATLTLTNTGHKSAVVNVRMAPNLPLAPDEQREVVFTLKSPSGAELPVRVFVNVRPPLDKDFAELAPGESVSRSMDLATFYSFSAPGKYTLQAVYKNVSDPSTGVAWKGQLGSDVVTFSVSE